MVASAGRTQVAGLLPAICHLTALSLLLLVLLSPVPLPFGPSLLKVTSASLNLTAAAVPSAGPTNATAFPGVNITLSNSSTVQVRPRSQHTARFQRIIVRDDPPAASAAPVDDAGPPQAVGTTSPPPVPTAPPPASEPPTNTSSSFGPVPSLPLPSASVVPTQNSTQNSTQPDRSTASTSIRMTFGPLGACLWSAQGIRTCSSPNLDAQYNLTALQAATDGAISTIGLPASLGGKTRSTILLSTLIVLLLTSALTLAPILARANPDRFGVLLEPGSAEQNFRTAQRLSVWALATCAVLFLGATISLRWTLNSAITAFNAANAQNALPPALTDGGRATDVSLSAETGNAFGLLWITGGLISLLVWVERRRARTAEAMAQARLQVDAEDQRRVKKLAAARAAAAREEEEDEEEDDKMRYPREKVGRQYHAKQDSRSSSIDAGSATLARIRRKEVDYGSQDPSVTRPARTKLAPGDRFAEEVERAESPQMRHQWISLQMTPERKQDLPLYMETDHASRHRADSGKPGAPQYF